MSLGDIATAGFALAAVIGAAAFLILVLRLPKGVIPKKIWGKDYGAEFDQIATPPEPEDTPSVPKPKAEPVEEQDEDEGGVERQEEAPTHWFSTLRSGDYREALRLLNTSLVDEEPEAAAKERAFAQAFAFTNLGLTEVLKDLQRNAAENPEVAGVQLWLGIALKRADRNEEAYEAFKSAFELASEDSITVNAAGSMARILVDRDEEDEARELLAQTLTRVGEPKSQARICREIAATYESATPPESAKAFAFRELAFRFEPRNDSKLFDLAYDYSEKSGHGLALLHYRELLEHTPDHAAALNNAGVEAQQLDLAIAQYKYWESARREGNTLAMANLAYQLIEAGRIDDAKELLDEARGQPEPHRNVMAALGRIAEVEEDEEQREEEIEERAQIVKRWRIRYAQALLRRIEPSKLIGEYTSPEGRVTVTETAEDGRIAGTLQLNGWSREVEFIGNAEASALLLTWKTVESDADRLMIAARRTGHAVMCFESDESTLLGYISEEQEALDPSGGKSPLSEHSFTKTLLPEPEA